jgi:hypothetical protein
MIEATDNETKLTYETAIRSFTEAEVALREIVSALERYRAASDSVEAAEAVVGSSQSVLAAALATLETTSVELASTAASLRAASTTVAALDPERFWSSFGELRSEVKTANDSLTERLEAAEAELSGEATRTREQVAAAIAGVREVANQARAAAAIGAVAGILAVVLSLVILLR